MKVFKDKQDARNWLYAGVVFLVGIVPGKVLSITAGANTSDEAPFFQTYCWVLAGLSAVLGAFAPSLPPRKAGYLPRRQWFPVAFILFLVQLLFIGRTPKENPLEMSIPIALFVCLTCAFFGTALRAMIDAVINRIRRRGGTSNKALDAPSEPVLGSGSSADQG